MHRNHPDSSSITSLCSPSCDSYSAVRAWRQHVAFSCWFQSHVFWRCSPSTATWSSSTTCSLASTVSRWAPHFPCNTVFTGGFLWFFSPSFSSSSVVQGPFVFFFRIVFNKEARNAMKYCCSRKRPDHMIKSKASVSPSTETLRLIHSDGFGYMLGAADTHKPAVSGN